MLYIAKTLSFASRLLKRGNGTALPGLLVETWIPWIIAQFASKLDVVVFISGTNGKTTTRAMLVHILENQGIKVITNRGGANIFRGIASTLFENTGLNGQLTSKIAILEVEEATLPKLSTFLPPQLLILTNVFRDQLDAYGEIDTTLSYFKKAITIAKPHVITNGDDAKLLQTVLNVTKKEDITLFGLEQSADFTPKFEGETKKNTNDMKTSLDVAISEIYPKNGLYNFCVSADALSINTFSLLPGRYNIYNSAAALAAAAHVQKMLKKDANLQNNAEVLQTFLPVFGRGEQITIGDSVTTLMLVKNPAGFNQVLQWIEEMFTTQTFDLAVCINDNIADGKDVSWLWDVAFEDFKQQMGHNLPATITCSGTRANDIALRLQYADFNVSTANVAANFTDVINLIKAKKSKNPTLLLCTYTALLQIRNQLSQTIDMPSMKDSGN